MSPPKRRSLGSRPSILTAAALGAMLAAACGAPPAAEGPPGPGAPAPASAPPEVPAAPHPVAEAAPAPTTEAVKQMLQPWTGDLDGMVERRYIRFLVAYNKTHYFFDGPEQRGVTYEAGKAFEEFVNDRLGSKTVRVNVAFLPVRRDQILQGLIDGRGDIAAAGLTITPQRRELVDFSEPGARNVRELVVTGSATAPLTSVEDLAGHEVHVRRSSSAYESLTSLNERLQGSGKPPVVVVEADEQLEDEDLLEMVNAGVVPATVVDDYLADFWAQVFPGLRVHHDAPVRTGGEIAWAMRKGSPQLREAADAFMREHGKGTVFGNVLLKRYLQSTQWVKNPTAEAEYARFRQATEFFRRYGQEYDLPWLLLAAQAYQESRIDQGVVSPAGAVGVMQIKPSTAAGSPVFIRDVDRSIENNINAGAKYLRFIVDEYFADAPMERIDKGLFAIASYNAGPARIARLRDQAAEMGLDPNRWFGNVELVAARDIGRETVQYVSNIYKYYVTYNLVAAQREGGRASNPGTP